MVYWSLFLYKKINIYFSVKNSIKRTDINCKLTCKRMRWSSMIDRLTVNNISYTTKSNSTISNELTVDQLKETFNANQKAEQTGIEGNKLEKEDNIEEVIKGINDFLQPTHTSIKFVLHEKLDDYYVNVVDDQTKEVIKEIPSKKLLDTYAKMMEFVGLIVDEKR
jgi:flagellar protein FlaG